jgi:hypothetical protein
VREGCTKGREGAAPRGCECECIEKANAVRFYNKLDHIFEFFVTKASSLTMAFAPTSSDFINWDGTRAHLT